MYDYNHKVALLCSKNHIETLYGTQFVDHNSKNMLKLDSWLVLLISIYLKHAIAEPNPMPFLSDCSVTYQFLVIMAPLNYSFMHHWNYLLWWGLHTSEKFSLSVCTVVFDRCANQLLQISACQLSSFQVF